MPTTAQNLATLAVERRAAVISLVIGVTLMGIKFAAYAVTDSSAIFSDALESIVNVLASGFALFAIQYSHLPADESHPYGHGKIEFFSAGLEGAMILMASVVIVFRAIQDLIAGPGVQQLDLGLPLIALAMLLNGSLGIYLVRRGRSSGSIALEADGHHLFSDAITSAAVLIALIIVKQTGWTALDPLCAMVISVYIAWMGISLVRRSAAGLMDKQDPNDDRIIQEILNSHLGPTGRQPHACSYHKLRHRHTGRYHWIDFHLVVPSDWDIARAHEAASFIEHEIEQKLGYADATAHVEPCTAKGCTGCAARGADALGG